MNWRGRLETRAAWWTLIVGVAVFVLSALAVPLLGGFGVIRLIRRASDRDLWMAAWGVLGALAMFRAAWVSIEALGQLWWRRLLDALAIWAVVAALFPGWWLARLGPAA